MGPVALALAVIGLVAAGCLVAHLVVLTIKWLINKIKEKLDAKNAKKVAVADLEKLISECDNTMSVDELDNYVDQGYSHVMVEVDDNNKIVGDIEIYGDENGNLDEEVQELLGRKGMVVVEA